MRGGRLQRMTHWWRIGKLSLIASFLPQSSSSALQFATNIKMGKSLLRFLTRNVDEPRHAKFVSEHAKRITPWSFLEWHCDVAAGRKLLEIAL